MRLFSCDASNAKQIYNFTDFGFLNPDAEFFNQSEPVFKLQLSTTTLCIDHRGVNANIGVDPLILKPCSEAGNLTVLLT
jgi:hypothetical protein